MTDELLPCPFCGGEADTRVERNANVVSVGCPDCNIRTQYMVADDIGIAEAITAWNRRAERTCKYVGDDVSGGCSECRGWLDPACAYCPTCGAKVVSA